MSSLLLPSRVLELTIGLLCACLPSVNLLLEKAISYLHHSISQPTQGSHRTPDQATCATASSYWSSLKSKIVLSTMRTLTMRGDDEPPNTHRWSLGARAPSDVEMGHHGYHHHHQHQLVVFNNRLDVPSIRSSSDNRPCSSKGGDSRGPSLPDSAFDEQVIGDDDDDDDDDDGSSTASSGGAVAVAAGRDSDEVSRRDPNTVDQ